MSELLLPAENMTLTVSRAQVERGENPTLDMTAVLIMALDRLTTEPECSRCAGTGKVFDEVFENEETDCPYWDSKAGLECVDGRIRPSTSVDTMRTEALQALHRVAAAKVEPQPLLIVASVIQGYHRRELMTEAEWWARCAAEAHTKLMAFIEADMPADFERPDDGSV